MSEYPKEKLVEASRHIMYEFRMLLHCARRLRRPIEDNENDDSYSINEKNMWLECFLLHARNLDEFMRNTEKKSENKFNKKYKDDIRYFDFIEHSEIPSILEKSSGIPQYGAINKRLSHLTYDRLTSNDSWKIQDIIDSIISRLSLFYETVDKDKLHNDWINEFKNMVDGMGQCLKNNQNMHCSCATVYVPSHSR